MRLILKTVTTLTSYTGESAELRTIIIQTKRPLASSLHLKIEATVNRAKSRLLREYAERLISMV